MTMRSDFIERMKRSLLDIETEGSLKTEHILGTPQSTCVEIGGEGKPRRVLNFCSNNYLGLANDERVVEAGRQAAATWGAGMASVRFICGTQEIHKELEASTADYLGFEDCIVFAACFDANGAAFEPLFGEDDAIISASLNHASIVDGIRLSKARRYFYRADQPSELERQLRSARANGAKTVVIATDGVFSMDGSVAPLSEITRLADAHDALVMVDDCHATGVLGLHGTGSAFAGRIDILTGTYGKALGGGMGGFICARREIIALLRQRARPYLFSNALTPSVCGTALEAIRISRSPEGDGLRAILHATATEWRVGLESLGFKLLPGEHPIVPIMIGDARQTQRLAAQLLDAGVLATGFSFPVVPRGEARIRTQLSASHTAKQLKHGLEAFAAARDHPRHDL
jgi:glycine C-acetyltransferase